MRFKGIKTGIIYNVTNKDLIPLYEGNEAYEKLEEEETKPVKKRTAKKAE